jgi:hypothetical protein
MKSPILFIPLVVLAASAHAATHAVLPGSSIQAKIDIAVAGDIVAIFGGIYNEDITINKAIRLVEVSGQQVTLAGNVTFAGVTNCPPFDGFTVGSSGRGITVTDTTGLVLRNLDARAGSGVTSGGTSTLKISDCQLSSFTSGGATAEVAETSVAGGINHTGGYLNVATVTVAGNFDTQSAAEKTVAFRTIVSGDCNWRSKKNWFGYSSGRSFQFSGNQSLVVMIGSTLNPQGNTYGGGVFRVNGSANRVAIFNNEFRDIPYFHWAGRVAHWNNAIVIEDGSASGLICNNFFEMRLSQPFNDEGAGWGVRSNSALIKIHNNIFQGCRVAISAPFGAVFSHNLHYQSSTEMLFEGGAIGTDEMRADPLFVENQAPTLQPTSSCFNAGTSDPRYNNRDGSRNTIGPSGGPWIDPDGLTTENPVVISFDLSPDMVLEGVDTEVILSEGQAVSAP